jgi:hypothetical protein
VWLTERVSILSSDGWLQQKDRRKHRRKSQLAGIAEQPTDWKNNALREHELQLAIGRDNQRNRQ